MSILHSSESNTPGNICTKPENMIFSSPRSPGNLAWNLEILKQASSGVVGLLPACSCYIWWNKLALQVVCPFILDQFYWAERMHWLGVSPEPLSRNHLLPDKNDNTSIHEAARVLSLAIHDALSSTVKARAAEIAERILLEDGVSEAIKYLKEELGLNWDIEDGWNIPRVHLFCD